MKHLLSLVLLFSFAQSAMAGKVEREHKKSVVDPMVQSADEAAKKSCGCGITLAGGKGIESVADWNLVRHMAKTFVDGVEKYCADAESKKAFCSLKSVSLDKGTKTSFTFEGGKSVAVTDGNSFPSFNMIMQVIDK